jgi:hypothetical protein
MPELVMLSLSPEFRADADDLVRAVRKVAEVRDVRMLEPRALDLGSVFVLIEVAGSVLAAVDAAWQLVERLRKVLGPKRLSGARITLPNGVRIELDQVTEEQLAQLIGPGPRT